MVVGGWAPAVPAVVLPPSPVFPPVVMNAHPARSALRPLPSSGHPALASVSLSPPAVMICVFPVAPILSWAGRRTYRYAGVADSLGCGVAIGVASFSAACVRMSVHRVVKSLALCASCLNCVLAVMLACDSLSGCIAPAIAHAQTSIRFSVVVGTLDSIAAASCRGGPAAHATGSWRDSDSASSSFILPHARDARFAVGDEPVLWPSRDAQMWAPLVDEFARAPVTMPRAIASTPLNRPESSLSAACVAISGTICTSTGVVPS